MTLKTLELHFVTAQQCTHATMREFNVFMPHSGVYTRVPVKRNCTRLRNRVPRAAAVSLNGMHIYGVAGQAGVHVGRFEGCRRWARRVQGGEKKKK